MIDIHSHIEKENGVYLLEKLLADMDRFQIQKRVISDLRVYRKEYNRLRKQ